MNPIAPGARGSHRRIRSYTSISPRPPRLQRGRDTHGSEAFPSRAERSVNARASSPPSFSFVRAHAIYAIAPPPPLLPRRYTYVYAQCTRRNVFAQIGERHFARVANRDNSSARGVLERVIVANERSRMSAISTPPSKFSRQSRQTAISSRMRVHVLCSGGGGYERVVLK